MQIFKEIIKNIKNPGFFRGMTMVELVVVLAIFSILSLVSIFNYGTFQAKVDIKNLASDVALKLVEAQKSALTGKFASFCASCKPSYGVYLNTTTNTKFISFADLDNASGCNTASCTPPNYTIGGEVQDIINITKGNTISGLTVVGGSGCPAITNLTIVFKRPSSSAQITSSAAALATCGFSYVQVNIASPKGAIANIKIYPSGRIQIN